MLKEKKKKEITDKQLIIRITFSLLIGSIIIAILFTLYIKNTALKTYAKESAGKTSKLIFEVMRTKMLEGWKKEDLNKIIKRLNSLKNGLDIKSYRSKKIEELFGKDPITNKMIKKDPILREVMKTGKEKLVIGNNGSINFYYPMIATKECIKCHTNAKVGDVNGVLNIYFSNNEIYIPLHKIILYFILFLILFLILIFMILYLVLNKNIVLPLVDLTTQIEDIKNSKNLNQKVVVKSHIKEIIELGSEFNSLLKQMNFYYDKMMKQFYTDQLTSMPNLLALKRDIKKNKNSAIVIFDIDQFQKINGYYGYDIGDFILIEFAKFLDKYSQNDEKFYRISGDEFAWLKKDMVNLFDLLEILEKIDDYPFVYNGSEIRVGVTCGVANTGERLIENAMAALHKAKNSSKPFEIYNEEMNSNDQIKKTIYWTKELKSAIKEDRILVVFQPILDIKSSKTNKFETLIRLKDRDGKIHSPSEFMQAAKLSRQYLRLTRIVTKKAFEYFKDKPYEFSINVSMDDIVDMTTRNYIKQLLQNFPEPSRIVFEILETEEIDDFDIIDNFSKEIHSYGAKLAIDDFGSGYSNYDYVIKLSVDYLKIDSSLIKYIDSDDHVAIVVESIIQVAKKLNLKTIAEFVHSKEVMQKIEQMGIDFAQGYYINKPLSSVDTHFIN